MIIFVNKSCEGYSIAAPFKWWVIICRGWISYIEGCTVHIHFMFDDWEICMQKLNKFQIGHGNFWTLANPMHKNQKLCMWSSDIFYSLQLHICMYYFDQELLKKKTLTKNRDSCFFNEFVKVYFSCVTNYTWVLTCKYWSSPRRADEFWPSAPYLNMTMHVPVSSHAASPFVNSIMQLTCPNFW